MLVQRIHQFIETHALLEPGARVLVGLSGGVDSVVLVHGLRTLGFGPLAAHLNHRLRGAASEEDEAFVRSLCEAWEVPLFVDAVDVREQAEATGQSLEAAAREVRYRFFREVAEAEGLRTVATAHHLDDQAETILLNLLRGAGPEGLAGMPVQRSLTPDADVTLVRPLLAVRKADLIAYARAEGLTWREDTSNTDLQHRRNAIRHVVVPQLEQHFGEAVVQNVARSGALLRAYIDAEMTPELEGHRAAALHDEPVGGSLDLDYVQALPEVWRGRLILEALRCWLPRAPQSYSFVREVKRLAGAQVGRRVVLPEGCIWRERGRLLFQPGPSRAEEQAEPMLLHPGDVAALPHGTVRVEVLDQCPERLDAGAPDVAFAAADALDFPLVVRPWEAGDRFQPLGMQGTKKVSDLLTDAHCPPHQRAAVYVVVSGEEIVWVAGYRLAEPVRVRAATTRCAKFTYNRAESG